ncbi:hypothetical protein [Desulfomicrobium orale]|uniref:Conjugal transfer protein TraD n=1 Tax=Desulfomicrobium orale DSM 12838 TaxID=888061 RepID=A0A0X8JR66_9BACT|nr:hypothetical protein [Desulfomicrobium orale]AMD93383.1 hypothetical protein AXF15_09920 [Desulfomicrobium orale DSM 12838]
MCEKNNPDYSYVRPTDEENLSESTNEKLAAISENPGLIVEFDPEQAELAGAFREDAMSEEDALDAMYD